MSVIVAIRLTRWKVLVVLFLTLVMIESRHGEAGITGSARGVIAPINTVSIVPATEIDLNAVGDDVVIASIELSNNYRNAFNLNLEFKNSGSFFRTAAFGDSAFATGVGAEVPITSFRLEGAGGILGAGLTPPSGFFTLTAGESSSFYIWDPGMVQDTVTKNYIVLLRCSWGGATVQNLQGIYTETITVSMFVGDGM